jgi:hypothetical protein
MAQPTSHITFKKDETQIMIFTHLLRLTPHAHLNIPYQWREEDEGNAV